MSNASSPVFNVFQLIQRIVTAIVGIALILVLVWVGPLLTNKPPVYADVDEHFRYASIGGEDSDGIPYWIWKVLPEVFADRLPEGGLTSLGFIQEPNHELPIGFAKSTNRLRLDVVTQNCATCHVGSLRQTPTSEAQIISAMPSNTVDLQKYIQFLATISIDSRFNADYMMPYIDASGANLNPLEKVIYRFVAIPQTRDALIQIRREFEFMDSQASYGPGRVDTFTSYKSRRFNFPMAQLPKRELAGIADFPSIWQQRPREGMKLHWDGNNDSIDERNKSAALALVQPTTINFESIHRIRDWLLDLPAPSYPYPVDNVLVAEGEHLFEQSCASCHAWKENWDDSNIGEVTPIQEIGTDPGRLDSYTYELASNQYTLFSGIFYEGEDQRFTHFRKTNGYANVPLDGLWLRAPYLHNGSVPTLHDLLKKPNMRPAIFYTGNDVFDTGNVGFVSDEASDGARDFFKYDTSLPGNGNGGHLYGTSLSDKEKTALVEYLKTI